MTELLSRAVVPVANEDDAVETYEKLRPHLTDEVELYVVNVIEKAGGGIDKAGVEQRKEVARSAFEAVERLADQDGVPVETEIHYGTDIVDTVREAAVEGDGTAIVFVSRGGGRIMDFLSGSVRTKLVTESELPVVVLPNTD